MDSNYHIFKKSVQSKGKTVHKWYCYWNDPITGVMRRKVCKGCKTQAEAYSFVSALPTLVTEEKITIRKVAEWMYVPGGTHIERMTKLGKSFASETLKGKRSLLDIFLEQFDEGHRAIYLMFLFSLVMESLSENGWQKNGLDGP